MRYWLANKKITRAIMQKRDLCTELTLCTELNLTILKKINNVLHVFSHAVRCILSRFVYSNIRVVSDGRKLACFVTFMDLRQSMFPEVKPSLGSTERTITLGLGQ